MHEEKKATATAVGPRTQSKRSAKDGERRRCKCCKEYNSNYSPYLLFSLEYNFNDWFLLKRTKAQQNMWMEMSHQYHLRKKAHDACQQQQQQWCKRRRRTNIEKPYFIVCILNREYKMVLNDNTSLLLLVLLHRVMCVYKRTYKREHEIECKIVCMCVFLY